MFKRNKHVFTCPDAIWSMNRRKKINRITLIGNAVGLAALMGFGWYADRKGRFVPPAEDSIPSP
jgi:hypothetical protein